MTLYYLVSPAGVPNYGDELIAATWLRHLARVAPDADVVVDCMNPERAAGTLAGLHPRLQLTGTLWTLCLRSWVAGAEGAAAAVAATVQDPSRAPDLGTGLELLHRADVVHLVGGGFINDIWPPLVGLMAGVTTAAQVGGARTAMTGQGLWPPPAGAAELVRGYAAAFDLVDVRDTRSAALLDGTGAGISGDDAYLGVPFAGARALGDVPEVMVSLQSQVSDVDTERLLAFVAEVLRRWNVTQVGLIECAPDADRAVLERAASVLPVARRYDLPEILRDGLPVAAGQCWLTTRFHPHLVAAAGGASGIALSIQPDYYGTKHSSLLAAGSRWRLLDDLSVPPRPADGGYPPQRLRELHEGKLALAAAIYPATVPAVQR